MNMNTMYDILLQLPLFQGLSTKEFTSILEKVKLGFSRYHSRETIVAAGDRCTDLYFLLRGKVEVVSTSPSGKIAFTEFIEAPAVFEPDALFSLDGHYFSTYIGNRETQTVKMDKSYIFSVLDKFEICRMNLRILLSCRGIKLNEKIWSYSPDGDELTLFGYIYERIRVDRGRKYIHAKMEDLSAATAMNRMRVSKILNDWSEAGIIVLHRQSFEIPDFQVFMNALKK